MGNPSNMYGWADHLYEKKMINYVDPALEDYTPAGREQKVVARALKGKRLKDLFTAFNKLSKNEKQQFKQFINK